MKSKIISTILLLLFSQVTIAQKSKVAVYVTGDDPINEIVASRLVDGLAWNGKYIAVERTASFLKALSTEHSYEREGTVDESQIAALGKQFSVQYVCVASAMDVWKNEKYITARIIDVETAEVVASGSSTGTIASSTELIKAMNELSRSLLETLDYNKSSSAKKVAVYVTRTGNRDVDIILGDQLVAGFASSGKYVAIERTNSFLSQISKEHGYQQSGAVDDADLMRIGIQFGVQYVCVAKTTQWAGDYFISTRLIDVSSAEVVNSYNAEGIKLYNLRSVVNVAAEIAKKLSGNTIEEEKDKLAKEQALKAQGLVDLGLPSGTLWMNKNEAREFYSYEQAMSEFGDRIPTKDQFLELKDECVWKWTGNGYKVIGPNDNFIFLPARGERQCGEDASIDDVWNLYWTATATDSDNALGVYFTHTGMGIVGKWWCIGACVRLVQK